MDAPISNASEEQGKSSSKLATKSRPEGKLYFTDLPWEAQKQVFRKVNRKDLFALQRTSLHFFHLATAEIYRDLDLNLTNSGDEDSGHPNSRAADALQTILASEYDYGQHIKSFRVGVIEDTFDMGTGHASHARQDPLLMTRLLWDSRSDSSKFLNTALLLVARKAGILETFQWDAPIELSGAVYQALHKLPSLRHLRVRLDITPSPKMIIRPGPPPGAHNTAAMQQVMQQQAQIQQLQQQQAMVNSAQYAPPPHPIPAGTSSSFTNPKMSNVKRKKIGGNGGNNYWANSRAFAGFKGLITLALVGMSNLDCLSEISECIKASSATLKSLTLSLSTELARKSRKPAPVNPELDELSDTEQDEEDEEEDTMNTQPPASGSQPAAPTNEADIRKEKIAQESILAKVFDLQSVSAEGKRLEKNLSLPGGQCLLDDENQEVIRKVNDLMKALMDAPIAKDLDVSSTEARMTHFQMIREVAELYIASQKIQQKKEQAKSILQSSKKPPTASKSLNPLASGFKPSSSSKPLGSTMDYEFQEFSSPSSPFYDPGSATWSNGTPKPYGASSSWSMVSPPPPNLPGGSNTKTAPSQAYTSPYVTGSYPVPPNPNLPYPYEHSNHSSSGVQSPPIFSPNTLGSSNGQSSFAWTPSQKDKESILSNAKNAMAAMGAMSQKEKTKAKVQKKPEPPKAVPVAESDDETVNTQGSPSLVTKPFFASNPEGEPADDGMEFDMEHPDEETADLGEDQVIIAGGEESPAPRKRAKVGVVEQINTSISVNAGSSSKPQVNEGSKAPSLTSDEAMQAYIRAAHGLQLEELSLEWIPLKASIVARALDLSVLKRVTLLEVGTQDAFWTLLVRLQSSSRNIAFNSIHTDNVSVPFLKFLATYKGLKELFMYERNTKQDVEAAAGTAVGIALIRNRALKIHISTLERVTIRNERAESWDVDPKTLRCLVQGTKLTELAFSLNMKTYHILMQLLAGFRGLYALHLISLRCPSDRSMTLHNESLNFAVDSLSHCGEMKLKYIALTNQVIALESRPKQFPKRFKTLMGRRKDKKGKGKEPASALHDLMNQMDDSGSDDIDDVLSNMWAGETKLKFTTRFADVKDVKIFTKEIRSGRL